MTKDNGIKIGGQKRLIVVGIDFGTTFSGVAWAETRRFEHSRRHEQSQGQPSGLEWGFQIPSSVERKQWFKLGLADDGLIEGPASEKSATSFLTQLYKHLMYTLEEKLGASILRTIPIQFCLTVPAIWSEKAKERTLRACQKAGFQSKSEITLISEPEAAATYALHGLDPHGLKVEDTFVLCDAGGGTVDLVSYTIARLTPTLGIREAAEGTGGLCGSTFLNRRFGEFLTRKLSREPGRDEEILSEAMDRFDSVIKKQFSAEASDSFTIPVAGLANNEHLGIRRGRLTVSGAEVRGIFDPVVEKIITLVREQIEATGNSAKTVLQIGGFGGSNYLKERLRISLGSNIKVLQPPNAWTAVVRGAVMMGVARTDPKLAAVDLVSRVSRKHYAITLNTTFDEDKHEAGEKYWDSTYLEYRVNYLAYFIKKGAAVPENKPVKISFHARSLVGEPITMVSVEIYCDDTSKNAPVHMSTNSRVLLTLKADLSELPAGIVAALPQVTLPNGKRYYRIDGNIEATFFSTSTRYVYKYKGRKFDSVTAEYA